MTEKYSLTSINLELQNCEQFGFFFECATCHHMSCAMLELAKDGIALSICDPNYTPLRSWQSKLSLAQTEKGKLSISCGFCRSGITAIIASRLPDGTSCSRASFGQRENEQCTHDPNTCDAAFCEWPKCNNWREEKATYGRLA